MVRSTLDATKDAFLGGRLQICQPRKGYRAGVDPVLLAASVPAKSGQTVLELGCGVGVAALCLAARVSGLTLTGVEVQSDYAALARRNAEDNKLPLDVILADLRSLPADLRQRRFDHVIMNPPYFQKTTGSGSEDAGREVALRGETALSDWLDIGARRLAPKGYLTLILRMERLPEALDTLSGRLGSLVVCPIAGRSTKSPERFLLQARQGGRAAFRMVPTLVMHDGTEHLTDSESYRPEVTDILRNGAAFSLPA